KFQITDRSDPCYKELDSQMHLFLIGKCRNKYLIDMMQTVFDFNRRIVNCSTENTAHIEEARGEHLQLLSLLLEEKYEEAENVMRIHISHCQAAAIQFFCVPPELR
ncbi:MAG: FCD domain-containing protein, partial [Sphaerochaetaceae bacterium]